MDNRSAAHWVHLTSNRIESCRPIVALIPRIHRSFRTNFDRLQQSKYGNKTQVFSCLFTNFVRIRVCQLGYLLVSVCGLRLESGPEHFAYWRPTTKSHFYRAACNATHGIAVAILSVRPSVRLSVRCVSCDKTKRWTADILLPHETAITLVFWHQQCRRISAYDVSTVTDSEKTTIRTTAQRTFRT